MWHCFQDNFAGREPETRVSAPAEHKSQLKQQESKDNKQIKGKIKNLSWGRILVSHHAAQLETKSAAGS